MKIVFIGIAIATGIIAGLCLLVLPLWIFGVPGVDNNYAKGWSMGLSVLFFYPLSWFGNYGVHCIGRKIIEWLGKGQQGWQQISSLIAVVLLLAAILRLMQAFRIMSS